MSEAVLLARDVGVLLWYGTAFDEGRLDKVVNEQDDRVELACLEAFSGLDVSLYRPETVSSRL